MPYATASDGTQLYYEVHGEGEPLLLIMGLGMNATGWYHQIPDLKQRFQVIAFDNRGAGRSGQPDAPYTIAQMADDATAVLDAADFGAAHVLGASMGGFIAQELALRCPGRVHSLILACTSHGGPNAVLASPEVQQALLQRGYMSFEEALRMSIPFSYAEETIKERPALIEEDIKMRLAYPTPGHSYLRQLQAAVAHDTWARLPKLRVPTLVMHGGADLLVPTANGKLLAERIPAAELVLFPDTGHFFFSEAREAVNETILAFLSRHTGRQ